MRKDGGTQSNSFGKTKNCFGTEKVESDFIGPFHISHRKTCIDKFQQIPHVEMKVDKELRYPGQPEK